MAEFARTATHLDLNFRLARLLIGLIFSERNDS